VNEPSEFEGRDLREALRAASAHLGLSEEELQFEVLEQGRRGLFGLGARSVRIRVLDPLVAGHDADEPEPERPGNSPKPLAAPPGPDVVRDVEDTVQRMLELAGLELRVTGEAEDRGVRLVLAGPDLALAHARERELLGALQLLLNRMALRRWREVGRIRVVGAGAEDEPRQRDDEIAEIARQAAQEVSRTGKARSLPPMNSYERRIVHMTIQRIGGLASRSVGDGAIKRVRIQRGLPRRPRPGPSARVD
jgi:spoIIIJ-associated protein